MLRIEVCEIRHEVLYDRHVRQRRNRDGRAGNLVPALGAGNGITTANIHRAGAANAFPARPAEGERRVDISLDIDQDVQNHRAAFVHIDKVRIPARILAAFRIITVNLEFLDVAVLRLWPGLSVFDLGVLWKRQLNHFVPSLKCLSPVITTAIQKDRPGNGIGQISPSDEMSRSGNWHLT